MMKILRFGFIIVVGLTSFIACNELRGPVTDERDDGKIHGTLVVSRGKFERGETVEVTFTIRNISEQQVTLSREDAAVLDLVLTSTPSERRWTDEVGPGLHELILESDETYTITWTLEDLDTNVHTIVGYWWDDFREFKAVVSFEYGPARY